MKGLRWYTYLLIDPRNELPFYVGKGTGDRMYVHGKYSCNRFLIERVKEIKAAGLKIIYKKVLESEDERACYLLEIQLIKDFGRENLCNIGRGGEGPPSGEDHPMKDPKLRALAGTFRRGLPSWNKGGRHTAEANQKNRKAHLGKPVWNKGKKGSQVAWNKGLKLGPKGPHSLEARKKMSLSKMGHTVSEKSRAKMRVAKLGRILSLETRRKMSLAQRRRRRRDPF